MSDNREDAVLADVTNKVKTMKVDEEAVKRVRDKNWAEPQKFDYQAYNAAPPKGQRADVPAEGDDTVDAPKVPTWMSNAAKYEWKEEYGDVGPRHAELEKELFGSEFKMKTGEMFSK